MNTIQKQPHMREKNGGFTLIEVLIAVVIFSTSIAGLLSIVGTGVGNINVSKNRLIGNYLAQEGIEIMRYKRDYMTAIDTTNGWTSFSTMMNNICSISAPCGVSALRPLAVPVDCGPNNPTNCRVVQNTQGNPATGAYAMLGDSGATSWTPTIFSRKIYLESPINNSADSYIIHSLVSWQQGTGTYTTSMSETIYNWH
jgi:prepilin-type N-terminal cleavage/methylation domain-containing protein